MTASEWSDKSIDELCLYVRPSNALRRQGVKTIGQLLKLTESDLRCIRHLGDVSIRNIREALAVHGLSLAKDRLTPADRIANLHAEHEHCMQTLMLGDDEAKKTVFRLERILCQTRSTLDELCARICMETGTEWRSASNVLPPPGRICEVETLGGTTLRAVLQRLPSGDYGWANGEANDYRVAEVTRWRGLAEGEW